MPTNPQTPKVNEPAKRRRILLKLSGEALLGSSPSSIDPQTVARICADVKSVYDQGIEICIVVGGGNIFRGIKGTERGIDRVTADHMGMLATVINALALQSALEMIGLAVRVMSAIPMETICEPYVRRHALGHIEQGRIIIFAAGTGNPYFTTDSAAVLRASEMTCDILLKGTKVDGIYSADPYKNPDAVRYTKLSYEQILREKLAVMDMSAIALARDNQLPVAVFSINEPGNLLRVVQGEGRFTLVVDEQEETA